MKCCILQFLIDLHFSIFVSLQIKKNIIREEQKMEFKVSEGYYNILLFKQLRRFQEDSLYMNHAFLRIIHIHTYLKFL